MSNVNRELIEAVIVKIDARIAQAIEPDERLQKLKRDATHLLAIEAQASWHPDWFADLRKIKAEVER